VKKTKPNGPLVVLPKYEPVLRLGVDYGRGRKPPFVTVPTNAQANALLDVAKERYKQDRKWGGPAHDDKHDAADWCEYIVKRLDKVYGNGFVSTDPVTPGDGMGKRFRARMVQIAALAVAAIEACDRKPVRRARR